MATQPPANDQGLPKVPLIASMDNRGESLTVDARLINGYIEKTQTGVMAVKRPGIVIYLDRTGGGLGLYNWNNNIFSISNGQLWRDQFSVGSVNPSGGQYSFSSTLGATPQLFFHNTYHAYRYDSTNGLVELFAAGLATTPGLVPGQAFLNGTTYAFDLNSNINGSGINILDTWDAPNVIKAQSEPDRSVWIGKQLAYVVAMKEWTTEAFYDAGNSVGSPLHRADGTLINYGCLHGGSVAQFENAILWLGSTRNGAPCVLMMEAMKAKIVSTPAVERRLQQANYQSCWSWSMRISGHRFYILTLKLSNLTLAFDITTGEWFQWTDVNGNYMPFIGSTFTTDHQSTLVQHEQGMIFKVASTFTTDNGIIVPLEIYTPNWDGGTRFKKYLPRMNFMTDQKGAGELLVRHSDDDYKTWSNFRAVDLSRSYPHLDNCGTFRKRAWHLRYEKDTALRLEAVELYILPGTS